MSIEQAILLGLVQGITEFLPVSSSGHLIVIPELFGWEVQSLAFDAMLHIATLAAIIVALWSEVKAIGKGIVKRNRFGALGLMILVATIPAVIIGLLFKDQITTILRGPEVVAFSLAFWGIVLYGADRFVKKNAESKVEKTTWKQAVLIGLAQALALIPGTSRSGITMTAGMFTGLNRETAARFSFLLGIPAIAGAGALAFLDVATGSVDIALAPLIAGFVTAFISGLFAIRFLLAMVRTSNFIGFAIYRVTLAMLIATLFL